MWANDKNKGHLKLIKRLLQVDKYASRVLEISVCRDKAAFLDYINTEGNFKILLNIFIYFFF